MEDVQLWGSAAQTASLSKGDLALNRDEALAEETHRKKIGLCKLAKDRVDGAGFPEEDEGRPRKVPAHIAPFVYVDPGEQAPSVGALSRRDMLRNIARPTEAFAREYASHFSASLVESVLADQVTRRCKNMELGPLSREDLVHAAGEFRSRKSDDEWLRGPRTWLGERACAKGRECEGLKHFKLEVVERPTEEEQNECRVTGSRYSGPGRLCTMCQRYAALKMYIAAKQNRTNVLDVRPEYHNSLEAGEYCLEQCIIVGASVNNKPVYGAMHLTRCYTVRWLSDREYSFAQTGYKDPADSPADPFA